MHEATNQDAFVTGNAKTTGKGRNTGGGQDTAGTSSGIPLRKFGHHDAQISALGFGGHHLGDAEDQPTAARIVQEVVDGGITFFDNCWEYHNGKSEVWMGAGLKGRRDKVFLMTKGARTDAMHRWQCKCSSSHCDVCRLIIWTYGKFME